MYPLNNKGKYLETLLNITNEKYISEGICVVSKIPVNINLIRAQERKITSATFAESINCDYIGVYQGQYFEFEAKETYKDYFDFNAIRKNQQFKLQLIQQNGGLAFLIVYFGDLEDFFIVSYLDLLNYTKENKKRIPHAWFETNCRRLYLDNELKLNYIKYINYLVN